MRLHEPRDYMSNVINPYMSPTEYKSSHRSSLPDHVEPKINM